MFVLLLQCLFLFHIEYLTLDLIWIAQDFLPHLGFLFCFDLLDLLEVLFSFLLLLNECSQEGVMPIAIVLSHHFEFLSLFGLLLRDLLLFLGLQLRLYCIAGLWGGYRDPLLDCFTRGSLITRLMNLAISILVFQLNLSLLLDHLGHALSFQGLVVSSFLKDDVLELLLLFLHLLA